MNAQTKPEYKEKTIRKPELSNIAVIARLENIVKLKERTQSRNAEWLKELQKLLGEIGLPTYMFTEVSYGIFGLYGSRLRLVKQSDESKVRVGSLFGFILAGQEFQREVAALSAKAAHEMHGILPKHK